jgi:heme oxygenase|tara:strand:- start:332 stop:874 length:543 start_codon:yes stop_codon:yes gene_type:complete
MSLKNLTRKNHTNAERSWFAGLMMSGNISNEQYALYLKQQYECYNALENRFNSVKTIECIPKKLKRATAIKEDIEELCEDFNKIPIFRSTEKYVHYILHQCAEEFLYAHVYVRYLGDLRGGQMIAKRIPGSGKYYKFEDSGDLEVFIRTNLEENEPFVNECNKCFESAITLFADLEKHLK